MPPTNWPPSTYPPWPPPELLAEWQSYSSLRALANELVSLGFTLDNATPQENQSYFQGARCDEGHQVTGRMVVSPSGTRYPFAVCRNGAHRDFLVLWAPYNQAFGGFE